MWGGTIDNSMYERICYICITGGIDVTSKQALIKQYCTVQYISTAIDIPRFNAPSKRVACREEALLIEHCAPYLLSYEVWIGAGIWG